MATRTSKSVPSGRPSTAGAAQHRASPLLSKFSPTGSHRVAPNRLSATSPPAGPADLYPRVDDAPTAFNSDGSVEPASTSSRAFGGSSGSSLLAAARAKAAASEPAAVNSSSSKPADAGYSGWQTDAAPDPPPKSTASIKGGLAARLSLAAATSGVGKGIKSIADIAKPVTKAKGGLKTLLTRSPLDVAVHDSTKARQEAKQAIAQGEINLNKLYARDHDGMVTARGLLVGTTRAMNRLLQTTELLEAEASSARQKLVEDQRALRDASSHSIEQLMAHREMLLTTMRIELESIETDTSFSINTLMATNHKHKLSYAVLDERLLSETELLQAELEQRKQTFERYKANAERTEARFGAEVARLCGVVEQMKKDMAQQQQEARDAHDTLARNMSNQLADKQQRLDESEATVVELRETLDGTSATLNGKLRDLTKETAEKEQRLEQEKQDLAERGRRATMELDQRLSMLKVEKEKQETHLAAELERTQTESMKQAETLKMKIEKMRKLQELALGGVAGDDGSPAPSSRMPSTRGRQLLYYESLKGKGKEGSSMSWRGNDVWAHEQVGKWDDLRASATSAVEEKRQQAARKTKR